MIKQGLASQLVDSYLNLETQTTQLRDNIRGLDPGYGGFTLGLNDAAWRRGSSPAAAENYLHWISEIFSCLDHRHEGDGRDTWQMAGLLVVPQEIIDQATELNLEKARFAQLIQQYRAQSSKQLNQVFTETGLEQHTAHLGSGSATRAIIKRLGAARVHLRHCTRQIVCLQEYPKFVSLSWVRQRRSIQKISAKSCIEKLEKLNRDSQSEHIGLQIRTISSLTLQEQKQLRQVQTVKYPSIKTKVYWRDDTEQDELDSHLGYLSMPALIPAGTSKQLPPMTNIAPTPPAPRAKRRSDNRIPEEPLCPSIRVYLTDAPAEVIQKKVTSKTITPKKAAPA